MRPLLKLLCIIIIIVLLGAFLGWAINGLVEEEEDHADKLSIEEASKIILTTPDFSKLSNKETDLIEITSSSIWDNTKLQLFKSVGDSSLETFIVTNQEAFHIGIGFGGLGVTSVVPYDVNNDGTLDLVYAYSFGSGIHRSVISWFDLKSYTEHTIGDLPERTEFRTYDLILKIESDEIVVYRIKGMNEGENNFDFLRAYPTEKDIDDLNVVKDGTLIRENGDLYNKQVQN